MVSETIEETDHRPDASRRTRTILLVAAAVVVGFVGRSIAVDGSDSFLVRWLPFLNRPTVDLFFADADGEYLVPVSRTVSRSESDPASLVGDLLAGPQDGLGLVNPIPDGTIVRSLSFEDGRLVLDLGGTYGGEAGSLAHEAVLQSVQSWPGVDTAIVTADGRPLDTNSSGHLLYFYDEERDMLLARPVGLVSPADVLAAYLDGPSESALAGLPDDIAALGIELESNGLLRLEFTYRPSLRRYALDHPDSVRRVLEGLIATFTTGFSQVEGVYLDFEGRNALGAGQCANMLNTAQLRPEVLNDERLLARRASEA